MAELLINRYKILETIDRNGLWEAFLAKDIKIPAHKPVIVKRIRLENHTDPKSQQIFKRLVLKEIENLKKVSSNCSAIPEIYDYFCEEKYIYSVQEYIQGQSLMDIVPIEINQGREIFEQISRILKHLHNHNIIHQNINPKNIILRHETNQVSLINADSFHNIGGYSNIKDQSMQRSLNEQLIQFIAPELANGNAVFASDFCSLAKTIIFALTHKFPDEWPISFLTGEVEWESLVKNQDDEFTKILNKAQSEEIKKRYQFVEEIFIDLKIPKKSESPDKNDGESQKPKPLNPIFIQLISILFLVIVGGIGYIVYNALSTQLKESEAIKMLLEQERQKRKEVEDQLNQVGTELNQTREALKNEKIKYDNLKKQFSQQEEKLKQSENKILDLLKQTPQQEQLKQLDQP
ncbi:MAG: protein kinase [Snowella sp.]|nr:protein kinase [Snowella sp.]